MIIYMILKDLIRIQLLVGMIRPMPFLCNILKAFQRSSLIEKLLLLKDQTGQYGWIHFLIDQIGSYHSLMSKQRAIIQQTNLTSLRSQINGLCLNWKGPLLYLVTSVYMFFINHLLGSIHKFLILCNMYSLAIL